MHSLFTDPSLSQVRHDWTLAEVNALFGFTF